MGYGTPEEQRAECESGAGEALNCAAATAVGDSYETCMSEMPAVECSKFADPANVLPESCRGVIETAAKSDAGQSGPTPGTGKPYAILGRRSSLGEFDTYLGCLCNSADPDSVFSTVGAYGSQSRFSQQSIWNRFGPFGSDFSSQSACNKFASDPPVVVNNGQIVGRLTRNQFAAGAVTDPDVLAFLNQDVCVD